MSERNKEIRDQLKKDFPRRGRLSSDTYFASIDSWGNYIEQVEVQRQQMLEALEEIFDTADMNIYVQGGGLQETTLLYLRPALQKAKTALEAARGEK